IDLEPNVIDEAKNGPLKTILNFEYLLCGKEDAANNFARGYYTIGRQMIDKVSDSLRKLTDNCDHIMGFLIAHSIGGGTGSGLGALILEQLQKYYKRVPKIGFEIYPSPIVSTCVVEPYNVLLGNHWLLDYTNITFVLENAALYDICQKKLHIVKPDINNLNRLVAKMFSWMAQSCRLYQYTSIDLDEMQAKLVPFPQIHFMTTGMGPIVSKADVITAPNTVEDITDECFKPSNWFVQCTDFDPIKDKYMAILTQYRGNVTSKQAHLAHSWARQNGKCSLIEWCPTGFRYELDDTPVTILEADDMGPCDKTAFIIANNTSISRMFAKRIAQKFDYLYSQQAFVHWYLGEGMEQEQFLNARGDLGMLVRDYADILSEEPTDDLSEKDEDGDYW
ncbi:hypothetical protein RFI_01702, partial [Reticulomyxa filosa]